MSARRWAAVLVLGAVPGAAAGQGLAERVRGVGDGAARFHYEARSDVEVCAEGIRIGERHTMWNAGRWGTDAHACVRGVVEVALELSGGAVVEVEVVRPGSREAGRGVDLGAVEPAEAARFLLGLARDGASRRASRSVVFPAMLADADGVWLDVLALARDRDVPGRVRKDALFWLGQEAADAATEGLADVATDDEEEQEVRDAAIFALSQRADDESVPLLMEIARTAESAETRRTAMFWLAQSGDDRVVAFFERVILGRPR